MPMIQRSLLEYRIESCVATGPFVSCSDRYRRGRSLPLAVL